MKLEDMQRVIETHADFKNEKTMLDQFLNSHGHAIAIHHAT